MISETLENTLASVPASALEKRPAHTRGRADHGWLKTAYSFSFANYYDPRRLQFEALRVINDDRIAPGGGFPMHPHRDFEIFSYVLGGQIAHRDSMGNGSTVGAGGIQYMTAGRGVQHSEVNPSDKEPLHLLQIWLAPTDLGATPRYETLDLDRAAMDGQLAPFVTQDGRDGSIRTLAPADIYSGLFSAGQEATFALRQGRRAYIHIATGAAAVNGMPVHAGDAVAALEPGLLTIGGSNQEPAEVLLFDLERLAA